jgi:anti-anti-sigma factor
MPAASDLPTAFTISVQDAGATRTVTPCGEIDVDSAARLGLPLRQCLTDGVSHVVLDLSETTFIDSTGIAVVVAATVRARDRAQGFVVIPGPTHVQHVFALCGLMDVIPFAAPPDATADPEAQTGVPTRPVLYEMRVTNPLAGDQFALLYAKLNETGEPVQLRWTAKDQAQATMGFACVTWLPVLRDRVHRALTDVFGERWDETFEQRSAASMGGVLTRRFARDSDATLEDLATVIVDPNDRDGDPGGAPVK